MLRVAPCASRSGINSAPTKAPSQLGLSGLSEQIRESEPNNAPGALFYSRTMTLARTRDHFCPGNDQSIHCPIVTPRDPGSHPEALILWHHRHVIVTALETIP